MLHETSIKHRWFARGHIPRERTRTWYIWGGILFTLLIALALLFHNYLLALLIFLGAVVIFFTKQDEYWAVEVSEYGIKINDTTYSYDDILSFWIGKDDEGQAILILRLNRPIHPTEVVPINQAEIDIPELRETLLEYIEEKEMDEPVSHKIVKGLRL